MASDLPPDEPRRPFDEPGRPPRRAPWEGADRPPATTRPVFVSGAPVGDVAPWDRPPEYAHPLEAERRDDLRRPTDGLFAPPDQPPAPEPPPMPQPPLPEPPPPPEPSPAPELRPPESAAQFAPQEVRIRVELVIVDQTGSRVRVTGASHDRALDDQTETDSPLRAGRMSRFERLVLGVAFIAVVLLAIQVAAWLLR
jgi:hypothetical protein